MRNDIANVQANRKLKQTRLKGFLQPNQPNTLISLLNLQRASMAILANLQQVPIVVYQRQLNDRPINVVPLPLFIGQQGSNLDKHLAQIMATYIANNARTDEHWKMIFLTILSDLTFQWYDC